MTNYNDGKWYGWNGGECPIHLKSKVDVAVRDPDGLTRSNAGRADSFRWGHLEGHSNIIAFRVVKGHREPREFWIWEDMTGCFHTARYQMPGSFKVREVLE